MKNLVLVSLTVLAAQAWAGVSSSGGGYAVVCRDQARKIQTAELLDLVEGKVRYGLTLTEGSGSPIKDYFDSVKNTYALQGDPMVIDYVMTTDLTPDVFFQRFMNITKWVKDASELEKVYDLGNIASVVSQLKYGCDVEQIAFFDDQKNDVHISTEAWNALDSLSKAALVQHELWYREARRITVLPESTSEKSRLNVAMIFSKGIASAKDGITNEKINFIQSDLNSSEDSTLFYRVSIQANRESIKPVWRLQFSQIAGRTVLSKTYVDLAERVNIGDRFEVNGMQFKGWYVEVRPVQDRNHLDDIKIRLFNDKGEAVVDLQ